MTPSLSFPRLRRHFQPDRFHHLPGGGWDPALRLLALPGEVPAAQPLPPRGAPCSAAPGAQSFRRGQATAVPEPTRRAGTVWAEPPGPWGRGRRWQVRESEGLHGALCGPPEPRPPSWTDPAAGFCRSGIEAVGEGLEEGRAASGARPGAAGRADPGSLNTVGLALGVPRPLPHRLPPRPPSSPAGAVEPPVRGPRVHSPPTAPGRPLPVIPVRVNWPPQTRLGTGCSHGPTAPSHPLASGLVGLVVFVSPPGLRGVWSPRVTQPSPHVGYIASPPA